MASTMLHEKCCNMVLLQIGAPPKKNERKAPPKEMYKTWKLLCKKPG